MDLGTTAAWLCTTAIINPVHHMMYPVHHIMYPVHHIMYPIHHMMAPLSIIWWTPSHPNEKSMNNSVIEWDIEKSISQHSLNSNSLILGLLKTRDIANLSKKGIHHMMYPVHHMMYPVHHMMDPPIHHMMDGVHHMMDGVHHMMDLYYIIYWVMNKLLKCF